MKAKNDYERKEINEKLKTMGIQPLEWFQFVSDVNMVIEVQKLKVDIDTLIKFYEKTNTEMAYSLKWIDNTWELFRLRYELPRTYLLNIKFERDLLLLQREGESDEMSEWTEEKKQKLQKSLVFLGYNDAAQEFELKKIFSLKEAKDFLLKISNEIHEATIPHLEKANSEIWKVLNEMLEKKETV